MNGPHVINATEIFGMPQVGNRRRLEVLPGGGYVYALIDDAVRIEVRYLRREFGHLTAEMDVQCEWAGAQRHGVSLSCADLNLSNQAARIALAKYCGERAHTKAEDFDWKGAIDGACLEVIRAERQSEAVITLDDAPEVENRDVVIDGLALPVDGASLLIAHGDSLKSLIMLYVLGTLAERGERVLYVDWEWTADRHRVRKCRLFGPERMDTLHYLRCRAPLVIECDRIRRYCDEEHVTFIGVDSIGLACDGKLVDDDVAIRFHRALGSLPSALCCAHVPKSSVDSIGVEWKGKPMGPMGPFGSVFFANLCRMSWLVKKQPGASDDVVTVGLFPQKQNDGMRYEPVGLEFSFSDRIQVRPVDLVAVEGLAEKMPLHARMRHALKAGPMTYAGLAEELGAKVASVVRAANRGDSFIKVPGADGVQRIALVDRWRHG
jgi:hypothetical protein